LFENAAGRRQTSCAPRRLLRVRNGVAIAATTPPRDRLGSASRQVTPLFFFDGMTLAEMAAVAMGDDPAAPAFQTTSTGDKT
jgi:hypothetical protein